MGQELGVDVLPPPVFAGQSLPYNWGYHQNPNIHTKLGDTGEVFLINRSQNKNLDTKYLPFECDPSELPQGPPYELNGDPLLQEFVGKVQALMEQRPIWTRRALANQLSRDPGLYMLRQALQFVGYQYRSGPFRDAVIRFGVNPLSDPSYRIYQTMTFKLYTEDKRTGAAWQDHRSEYVKRRLDPTLDTTHIFDGENLSLDGKTWQICDITDPLLLKVISNAQLRDEVDKDDGWYCNGAFAKIKAIMKTKLHAIRSYKAIVDEDFEEALALPDHLPGRPAREIRVPVPDMRLTTDEAQALQEAGTETGLRGRGIRQRTKRAEWRQRRLKAMEGVLDEGPSRGGSRAPVPSEEAMKGMLIYQHRVDRPQRKRQTAASDARPGDTDTLGDDAEPMGDEGEDGFPVEDSDEDSPYEDQGLDD